VTSRITLLGKHGKPAGGGAGLEEESGTSHDVGHGRRGTVYGRPQDLGLHRTVSIGI
jgi:hypothetical protein